MIKVVVVILYTLPTIQRPPLVFSVSSKVVAGDSLYDPRVSPSLRNPMPATLIFCLFGGRAANEASFTFNSCGNRAEQKADRRCNL